MPTRWRCPPENSWGKRLACSGDRPTIVSSSCTRSVIRSSFQPKCTLSGSASVAPTVMRGLSDAYGSWKTIWNRRRILARSLAPLRRVSDWPSKSTSPEVGSMRSRSRRPVVDLPQPDSPTRPRVSPSLHARGTRRPPRTPWPTARPSTPPRIGKSLTRSVATSSGASPSRPRAPGCRSPRSCLGLLGGDRLEVVRRASSSPAARPRRPARARCRR